MHAVTLRTLVISFIGLSIAACGKPSTPAGDTTSAKAAEPKAATPADAEGSTGDAGAKPGENKKKADDEMKVVRKAKDYITAPDVVFMYSFNASDAKEKAEKTCSEKAKGDQAKQAACMTAAQKKFGADGYHFTQDDNGKWYWEVVQVKNGVVHNLHRVPIEFENETDTSVGVKVIGKDEAKGGKGSLPSEVKFDVPNGYQIVQTDSDNGKIVFEAKLGLLGDQSKKKR